MGRGCVCRGPGGEDFLHILDSPSMALTDLHCLATPLLPLLQKIGEKAMEYRK